MPKKIAIEIHESLEFLKREYSKSRSILKKDRIKTLLYLKEGKYNFQSDIGKKLGRTEKTIRGWVQQYLNGGFSNLVKIESGGNNTRTISLLAQKFIADKVNDANSTVTSYVELNSLIEQELKEKLAYGALYSHCKRKHKSKLKIARKSHYKKDAEAEELFKKP
jgi:transposase